MHVILNLERAGAQEVVRTLCKNLSGQTCVSVVCTFEDGPVRHDLEALGIPVEVLAPRRHGIECLPWFLAEMASIRRRLARLVEAHEVDVIQTHLLQTLDFLPLSLLRTTRLRAVLWTIHNVHFLPDGSTPWLRLKRWGHCLLYRWKAGRVHGVVAVSDRVRDAITQQIGPMKNRITVIANGVDTERFSVPGDKAGLCLALGIDGASTLVATAGRLTEQKGHRYLLEAAASVVEHHRQAHFLLAGEGELKRELESRVQRLGLSKNVHFLGLRQDMPRLLASVDLFVLPSLWEGFSIVLLEAMAAGKPIVATEVAGADQALIPGETGLVVPPRDSRSLAEAISRMLSDPEGARAMGGKGRERAAGRFSARAQAREYLDLYRKVLRVR